VYSALEQTPASDSLSDRTDSIVRRHMREHRIPGISLGVVRAGKLIKATG